MAVVLAMLLAFAATLAVFLYVRGVRQEAKTGGGTVDVIVSKQDIPVGQALNALIEAGAFTTKGFPRDSLVQGAVTDLNQLRGQTAAFPILAGEQISSLRFQGATQFSGLGTAPGFEAITVSLDGPRGAGGIAQRGDHVTVFATFGQPAPTRGAQQQQSANSFTVTLIPDVKVLRVLGEGPVVMTLELKPQDAQKMVYATEKGTLWLGLLPPGEQGKGQSPTDLGTIVLGQQAA
jgi:pilus assembly protein CpaB